MIMEKVKKHLAGEKLMNDDFFEEMNNMRKAMDKMFNKMSEGFDHSFRPRERIDSRDSKNRLGDYRNAWVDMRESESEYLIAIELPGVNKEDIDLNLSGNFLEIKAQRKQENKK